MLVGFGRVPGCLGLGALFLWDEWRDARTDCQRGGCMVVPGAVVSPGHTRRLRRLSCRAPHNSPCTLMPYLAQTDGAYSAACGRRVPSRQVPQAPSMTSGLLRRTGSRPCSRPAGSLSVLVFGGVRCGGLPGGGGPSALRWMAAGAEFPCGVPGGGIGAVVDALWGECGIGAVVEAVE